MICTKCKTEGVRNQVFGNEFWYCRTCKDEIFEDAPKPKEEPETGIWGGPLTGALYNTQKTTNYSVSQGMRWSNNPDGSPIGILDELAEMKTYGQLVAAKAAKKRGAK